LSDKQIIGLVAGPVQRSFHLTDSQLGVLQGAAFALGFAIGGLPIARLIDTGNRLRVAAGCVFAWSLATIGSALAPTYGLLVLSRALTAVAEAGLPPAAFSIFSSAGDRRLMARLTGTFMLAPFLGGGLVLLGGGVILGLFEGDAEAWRKVFMAVGLPGLLLAPALLFFGVEPARANVASNPTHPTVSYRDVLLEIFIKRAFLRNYFLGLAAFYLFTAALLGWFPTFLSRQFALTSAQAGGYAGIAFLVAGVGGTFTATALFSTRKSLAAANIVRDFSIVAGLTVPVVIALPLVGTLIGAVALYALYAFLSAMILATLSIPLQLALDERVRARGLAIVSLVMSAGAGSLGPLLVGLLSDHGGVGLGGALASVGAGSSLVAALLFVRAWIAARLEGDPGSKAVATRFPAER
jgi:MFS family permease